jgi:hypothetical protein
MDLRLVRDNLGHASLTTTSIHLHTEDNERHEATVKHHRMSWDAATAKAASSDSQVADDIPGLKKESLPYRR